MRILLLLGTMACAVDDLGDENLSETSQAVTALGYWWWGVTNNDTPPADLGPSTDRTCFLQGIGGELGAAPGTIPARVSLYISGDRWKLRVNAGGGRGVVGYATCIPVTTNRRWIYWTANQPRTTIAKNPATHCFLSTIYSTTGFYGYGGAISVDEEPSVWSLGGYLSDGNSSSSPGGAIAVCVDFFHDADPYTASDQTLLVAQESKAVCSMRSFGRIGVQVPDPLGPLDWNKGARLKPDSIYNSCAWGVCWWKAVASPTYTISGDCLHFPQLIF